MDYQLTLIDHPAYLHARGSGPRTADNALRFLKEAYDACRAVNVRLFAGLGDAGAWLPDPAD